jgi:hypothetical protein
MTARLTSKPDADGAHGALDVTAANKPTSREDRRLYIVSLRFTEHEMRLLRHAITPEEPTVTEVIRARLFLRPIA